MLEQKTYSKSVADTLKKFVQNTLTVNQSIIIPIKFCHR